MRTNDATAMRGTHECAGHGKQSKAIQNLELTYDKRLTIGSGFCPLFLVEVDKHFYSLR